MSVFNQRSVINVWLLAPLPAVAVSLVSFFLCPVCPWLWQPAAGFIHVTQRCVQSWGRYSASLLGGTDPQHERLGPSLKCSANFSLWLHWHWPRNTQFAVSFFCPTVLRVCVWVCVRERAKVRKKERMCNQVRFQPWRTWSFSVPAGLWWWTEDWENTKSLLDWRSFCTFLISRTPNLAQIRSQSCIW